MSKELPPQYNPKEIEEKIYRTWEESGFFNPDMLPARHKKPFAIMMAPPSVTGHIHIGHALENTLSDILIRLRRMQGYKTLFLPGKDHAGIAAQYVVERELRKEGMTRFDLGKEKFVGRMWQWMKENGDAIDRELKMLGISCDWTRARFTMDDDYQASVKKAFLHYYEKGWIYRGKRIVNWCSRCRTSISDLEVAYAEEKGKLWHIRYPLKDGSGAITVATTRPETLLGDAAVAVNPHDLRYKELIGKIVALPIQNREIPIIADDAVDSAFGTGAVKITPGHDVFDFEIAERHHLPLYEVINEQGRMTEEAGTMCAGFTTAECRETVIIKIKELGLLEREEEYAHAKGHCERCTTVVEPLLSDQWFLAMKQLAAGALRAVDEGKIKFIPAQRKDIFLAWLGQVRDWNISRQLWWGHKIPLEETDDVLDTWFSSALWPYAALGWPEKTEDLKTFYPTDFISSAREIFFLWIVRMVYSGLELMGEAPFHTVYTHATVLDAKGRKMSKSLGNVVSPRALIEKYGKDTVRFGLVWQTMGTQDIHWDESALVAGKKFANKIWNAARFVLLNAKSEKDFNASGSSGALAVTDADRKISKDLETAKKAVAAHIEKYEFGHALHVLYDFFWHEFCDVYIEASKETRNDALSARILMESLKLLHPFMPFVTEAVWEHLPIENKKLLLIEEWPS